MDHIHYFNGIYRFLSNFFIEPDGTNVEQEFQREKCADPKQWPMFDRLGPREAKRLGRQVKLRPDWDAIKLDVMYALVKRKFDDHWELGRALLDTQPAILEEGNTWGDTYWGVVDGIGHNHLGRILMRVREQVIPF